MQSAKYLRTALAVAAVSAIVAGPAQAVIVVNSTPLSIPANGDGLYINLVTGATGASASAVPGWDINPYLATGNLAFFWGGTANPNNGGMLNTAATGFASLPVGSLVSSAATFGQSAQSAFATAFRTPGTHFLGVRFQNEATNQVNYGYMHFQVGAGSTTGFPLTLVGWAYENTGAGINVAAIPEPGTYALMLAGLAGIAGFAARRRKAA